MGILIGYRGTLDDVSLLDNLIAEVGSFCQHVGWEYSEVSEQLSGIALLTAEDFMKEPEPGEVKREAWPEEETFRAGPLTIRFNPKNPNLIEEMWRGVIADPPGCESLHITFDGQGRLCRFDIIPEKWKKGPLKDQNYYLFVPLYCKTSGQLKEHISICALLKMLRDRYIKDLDVSDDTGYYDTGDLNALQANHQAMTDLVGLFKSSPEMLKGVMKAAGIEGQPVEMLPSELSVPREKAKAAKPTVN